MRKKLEVYLQQQFHYSSLDARKIIYGMEVIFTDLSKLLLLFGIALPLGYADELLVATIILLSIRSNSGGLHFTHYISCFAFTFLFYASTIFLSQYEIPNSIIALGLLFALGAFSLIGPITSPMRPRLTFEQVHKYSCLVTLLILLYSALIILLESLPYRALIYWVIVLQIFQLLCAKIARKGESYEKIYDTNRL